MSGRTIVIETAALDAPCVCSNCDWKGQAVELLPVTDCTLTPGDPSPAGRCPDCDCLAYLDRPLDQAWDVLRRQYDGAGNLKLLPGDDRAAMAVEDARQIAEQFGVETPDDDPDSPTRVHTGEFSKAIMAGYRVEVEHTAADGSVWWSAYGPPDDKAVCPPGADFWPSERAAWEACDNHRMFGTTTAPSQAPQA